MPARDRPRHRLYFVFAKRNVESLCETATPHGKPDAGPTAVCFHLISMNLTFFIAALLPLKMYLLKGRFRNSPCLDMCAIKDAKRNKTNRLRSQRRVALSSLASFIRLVQMYKLRCKYTKCKNYKKRYLNMNISVHYALFANSSYRWWQLDSNCENIAFVNSNWNI